MRAGPYPVWAPMTYTGVGVDPGKTVLTEPTPQPMVKDAVVFAPSQDKDSLFMLAARLLVAAAPNQAEHAPAEVHS